tara:strand:- start:69 stop:314 length:246 start_codon:yes stop_codon:yes gene_type:complete
MYYHRRECYDASLGFVMDKMIKPFKYVKKCKNTQIANSQMALVDINKKAYSCSMWDRNMSIYVKIPRGSRQLYAKALQFRC